MSSIDILLQNGYILNMTSSLHVSLPDEMRHFVDQRTDGKKTYSTPSEYVRALIREDMEKQADKTYVYKELLKAESDIQKGHIYPDTLLDDLDRTIDARLDKDFD